MKEQRLPRFCSCRSGTSVPSWKDKELRVARVEIAATAQPQVASAALKDRKFTTICSNFKNPATNLTLVRIAIVK
jgi:hypothetical protein